MYTCRTALVAYIQVRVDGVAAVRGRAFLTAGRPVTRLGTVAEQSVVTGGIIRFAYTRTGLRIAAIEGAFDAIVAVRRRARAASVGRVASLGAVAEISIVAVRRRARSASVGRVASFGAVAEIPIVTGSVGSPVDTRLLILVATIDRAAHFVVAVGIDQTLDACIIVFITLRSRRVRTRVDARLAAGLRVTGFRPVAEQSVITDGVVRRMQALPGR